MLRILETIMRRILASFDNHPVMNVHGDVTLPSLMRVLTYNPESDVAHFR